jgi:SAM-dependent methyltransferase
MKNSQEGENPKVNVNVNAVEQVFQTRFGFMGSAVSKMRAEFGTVWEDKFEHMLSKVFPEAGLRDLAVEGYVEFAIDALRLHRSFEKTRKYLSQTYEEAGRAVYHNQEYMNKLYLPGILLSHYIWPHHYAQDVFFENSFLSLMQQRGASSFYEVGVGTGYYSRVTLNHLKDCRGRGFDISSSSRAYALSQVKAFGCGDRFDIELRNVITEPVSEQREWLISVEVLEHLEDPVSFLKALRQMLKSGGRAFITAALNAPNADHIFLYENPGQLVEQLGEAGFHVEQYHFARAYRPRSPELPVPEVASFIAS